MDLQLLLNKGTLSALKEHKLIGGGQWVETPAGGREEGHRKEIQDEGGKG